MRLSFAVLFVCSVLAYARPLDAAASDRHLLSPRISPHTTVITKEKGGPFPLYDHACKSGSCKSDGTVDGNTKKGVTCQLQGVDGESNFYKVEGDGRYISEAHVQPWENGFLWAGPDNFNDLDKCYLELRYYSEQKDEHGRQISADIGGAPGECLPIEQLWDKAPIDGYVELDNSREDDDKINFCWMYQDTECNQRLNGPNTELGGHSPRRERVEFEGGLGEKVKAYKCW